MAGMATVREPWSAARTRGWWDKGKLAGQAGQRGFIRGSLGKRGRRQHGRPLRRYAGAGLDGSRNLSSPVSHVPLLSPGWVSRAGKFVLQQCLPLGTAPGAPELCGTSQGPCNIWGLVGSAWEERDCAGSS